MGPTLSPTLVLRAAVPWGLGFLGTFGAWEPEPRSQGSGSRFGLLLPDYWPHSPQLPPHWNWLLFTRPSSQRALISHIALNFKIAMEINSTLLSILKSDPPLCSSQTSAASPGSCGAGSQAEKPGSLQDPPPIPVTLPPPQRSSGSAYQPQKGTQTLEAAPKKWIGLNIACLLIL